MLQHRSARVPDTQTRTCSLLLFLAAHFPLFPALLVLLSALARDGDTDVMIVGWTIHCRSGVLEIAVTVGTNEPGDSASAHEPCDGDCDGNIYKSSYINTTLIYAHLDSQTLKGLFINFQFTLMDSFFKYTRASKNSLLINI